MYLDDALTRTNDLIYENVNWAIPNFKPGDFKITLTWPSHERQYKKYYQPDIRRYSNDIRHYLHRVNRKFLGRDYQARGLMLKAVNSFEFNASQGIHCHMALEDSVLSRVPEDECINELLQCWLDMKCSGYVAANEVMRMDYPQGWIEYIFKDTKSSKTEFTDYDNWCLK